MISGHVTYQEEKLDWQVKILWKKLNEPKKEKPVKEAKPVKEEKIVPTAVEESSVTLPKETAEEEVTVQKAEPKRTESKKQESKKKEAKKPKSKKTQPKKVKAKKIQCSIQKISDKIKEIIALKDKIVAFIESEVHKKAFQKLLKELLRLLKKLKPKKLKANVEFGFEDPSKTGTVLAYLSMLYPF